MYKMRILIDARTLGSRPSGIGMSTYNFIRGIQADGNHEIILATDVIESEEIRGLEKSGIKVVAYGASAAKTAKVFSYFHFIQKTIHRVKPDIFWEPNNLFPIAIRNPYGKICVTVNDLFPFTMPECYTRLYPMYYRYGMKKIVRYADAFLYISEETRKAMESYFPKARSKPHRTEYIIIPNPSDSVRDTSSRSEYFLYIGNLERRKGTDILIKGYMSYVAAGGQRPLYLGGKVRESAIQELLEEAQKTCPGLRYLGYVSDEEREAHYAHCYGLVFPSRAEGFGMPVIEALSYGKPVLVSDLPIFREIAGDAVSYFHLSEDVEAATVELAKAMEGLQPVDLQMAESVVARYGETILTKKLLDFFGLLC